jgi:hypothetical protein
VADKFFATVDADAIVVMNGPKLAVDDELEFMIHGYAERGFQGAAVVFTTADMARRPIQFDFNGVIRIVRAPLVGVGCGVFHCGKFLELTKLTD